MLLNKRDKANLNSEGDSEALQSNILLQTIYVPKNLMFLTDNLPKPKYEIVTIPTSNGGGSDNESNSYKKRTLERIKYSPLKRQNKHADEIVLPNINKRNSSNIIEQIKETHRKDYKSKRSIIEEYEKEIISELHPKNVIFEIGEPSPPRIKEIPKYNSESRSNSLDYASNNISKELPRIPSLEDLNSRERNKNKLSSVERIASKLSMNNNLKLKMPRLEQNAYDNNMSLDPVDLNVLSLHK